MKRRIVLLSIIALATASITSCKKEEQEKAAITQPYNIVLKANEAYTFTLPKNKRNDAYEFTTAAAHASISEIGTDASGNPMYSYTPELNYVGSDQVVLSNDYEREEHAHKPPHKPLLPLGPKPKGDCNGGEEDHYIVTINFVVEQGSTARSK